jgi:hypothetical protein
MSTAGCHKDVHSLPWIIILVVILSENGWRFSTAEGYGCVEIESTTEKASRCTTTRWVWLTTRSLWKLNFDIMPLTGIDLGHLLATPSSWLVLLSTHAGYQLSDGIPSQRADKRRE